MSEAVTITKFKLDDRVTYRKNKVTIIGVEYRKGDQPVSYMLKHEGKIISVKPEELSK